MRRFLLGVAGAAFGLASVNAASAATVASLIASNLVGTGEVQFEDLSVETITSGGADGTLDVGDELTGYAYIDNLIVGGNTIGLGGSNSAVLAKFVSVVGSKTYIAAIDSYAYSFSSGSVEFFEATDGDAAGIDQSTILGATIAQLEAGVADGVSILKVGLTGGDTGEGWTAVSSTDDITAGSLDVAFKANLSVISSTLPVVFSDNFRTFGTPGDGSGTEARLTGRAFPNSVSNPELPAQNDADLFITVTVVPEPVTAGLGLLGLSALALRRRRA